MSPVLLTRMVAGVVVLLVVIVGAASSGYVVEPGYRGVQVTLGRVSPLFKPEGFGVKPPFISRVHQTLVRQQTARMEASCYSSDLQQVVVQLKVLYRIPESAVVRLYRDYQGDAFDSLLRPRVAEAVKELTAMRTAEAIVQEREQVKALSLDSAREKVGDLLMLEDLVLEDIRLTGVLESAIEAKMVQEQEAARARFAQRQAETEAETQVIEAKGEADAIRLRGMALRENPSVLELQIVGRWDGVTPLVVGPGVEGAELMLPLGMDTATNGTGGAQ